MNSILEEISHLRGGDRFTPDLRNRNRYCVIAQEEDGSRTAYCFGVPIYNLQSRKLITFQFSTQDNYSTFVGSTASIHIADSAVFENAEGKCSVSLPGLVTSRTDKVIRCEHSEIYPTVNGLLFKTFCLPGHTVCIRVRPTNSFMNVRANDKYFSLMRATHRPYITVSTIGTADAQGHIVSPCTMNYQKISEDEYTVLLNSQSPYGNYVLYEINLQEEKLFQDTTVESQNPGVNNAFGSTAFIGDTALFGEQWLYSRPDFSRIAELYDRPIQKVMLYIPKHIRGQTELSAFRVSTRFCSFGSTWKNKISGGSIVAHSQTVGNYHSLDMSEFLLDTKTNYLRSTDGFILKTKVKGSGFSAIATGDSSYAPQILSVQYR